MVLGLPPPAKPANSELDAEDFSRYDQTYTLSDPYQTEGGIMSLSSSIQTHFNEEKTTAAAALLLKEAGGRMRYFRLIKLLYLADRESWLRFNRPISGDKYVSMKHGPVLSKTYNLILETMGSLQPEGPWMQNIESVGRFEVGLKTKESDFDTLCEAEIEILKEVYEICRKFSQWKLRDLTHLLPEWTDPGDSTLPISPEDILHAQDKSAEEIDEARQDAIEQNYFDEIFGS